MSVDLLTVTEAAEQLRKSPAFVIRELTRKNLRGAKFGGQWHIDPAALRDYIEAHMNVAPVRRRP